MTTATKPASDLAPGDFIVKGNGFLYVYSARRIMAGADAPTGLVRLLGQFIEHTGRAYNQGDVLHQDALVTVDLDEAAGDGEDDCPGHESLAGAHMGEAVYCDGSCRS